MEHSGVRSESQSFAGAVGQFRRIRSKVEATCGDVLEMTMRAMASPNYVASADEVEIVAEHHQDLKAVLVNGVERFELAERALAAQSRDPQGQSVDPAGAGPLANPEALEPGSGNAAAGKDLRYFAVSVGNHRQFVTFPQTLQSFASARADFAPIRRYPSAGDEIGADPVHRYFKRCEQP